jgi:NAD(P)-dependent dehydrogenase (short-subunit alcohol dehydrogenase family)
VAEELRSLGADAVASDTAVGTPEAARTIVSAAMKAFGRIDILVNNAGISLPGLITDHDDADVETLFRTNLLGPYALLRAAWPVMREQGYGRVLSTSSNSAFGIGANGAYSTAKAALLGMTADAAIEGRPHGILVNAMMPTAFSRMIEQIPDPRFVEWFRDRLPASKIGTGVAYFLSRESTVTGRIFVVGGGRLSRVAFTEARGWNDAAHSAEQVADHLSQIESMDGAIVIDSQADSMALMGKAFPYADGSMPSLDLDAVIGAAGGKQP